MKLTATPSSDFHTLIAAEIAAAENAVTAGVRAAAAGLKDRWRGQIIAAGLVPRLARTIRQQDFPAGEPSLRAASLVYSRAATIMHAFDQGVLIRAKDGFYLAIPLQKGQLSCRELMHGQVLRQAVAADAPLRIDDIDGPHAENESLRQLIYQRGL